MLSMHIILIPTSIIPLEHAKGPWLYAYLSIAHYAQADPRPFETLHWPLNFRYSGRWRDIGKGYWVVNMGKSW